MKSIEMEKIREWRKKNTLRRSTNLTDRIKPSILHTRREENFDFLMVSTVDIGSSFIRFSSSFRWFLLQFVILQRRQRIP